MTRRDGALVLFLVALLAVLGTAVAMPAFAPAPSATPQPTARRLEYAIRQGVVSRPYSVTPVTARTQADRDLVALLFRGLVRPGPDGRPVADLASSWKVEAKGARWTFKIRSDARWQDGRPVTSDDVMFTIHVLQDAAYDGPLAAGWQGVTATAIDDLTVRFDLVDPLAGFLQAATQPILPAFYLRNMAVTDIASSTFATQSPIGNTNLAVQQLDADTAILVPVVEPGQPGPLASVTPVGPEAGRPYAERVELHFYDTGAEVAAAYRNGAVDSASGLTPALAMELAAAKGSRLIRYPSTTLTAVVLNLRPGKFAFASRQARLGLLAAIDRDALVAKVLDGAGSRADTLIPPSSWAFDMACAAPVAYDRKAASAALTAGGWKKSDSGWVAPRAKAPEEIELLVADADASPVANATARSVMASWKTLGLTVKLVELAPGEFVSRVRGGRFTAAVIDLNLGLDPDLYPLLASTQVVAGGSNLSGIQDAALDAALTAARRPAATAARTKAYQNLQKLLGSLQPMLPLFFRDVTMVASDDLTGPAPRPVSDPSQRFGDVVTWRVVGR